MNETKFTPGPWTVDGRDVVGMVGEIDTCIAECFDHSSIDRHNAKANANLIAAAPDLYEALDNLENDDGSIPDHAWKLVQAALAKARGEG